MRVNLIGKKMDKLWKSTRKDLMRFFKEADGLLKKGERYLKDTSEKGKRELEITTLSLQRGKLYYELGKIISNSANSNKDGYSKKALAIINKIKDINRKIKKGKRKKA